MKSLMNSKFNGTLKVPGDKSITHRALMFGALAAGTTRIHYPLPSEDTHRTLECMRALGAEVEQKEGEWVVTSPAPHSFTPLRRLCIPATPGRRPVCSPG